MNISAVVGWFFNGYLLFIMLFMVLILFFMAQSYVLEMGSHINLNNK